MANENQDVDTRKGKTRGESRDYPVITIKDAIQVAKVVKDCGGSATRDNLEAGLGKKGGQLGGLIAGAKRYGFIKGRGEMSITELSMKILNPMSNSEKQEAYKEAFFKVPLFKEVYERFEGKFPKDDLFRNILIRNYNVKTETEATRVVNLMKDGVKSFITFEDTQDQPSLEGVENEEEPPKGKLPITISKVNNDLFKLIKTIGYLEALSEYNDDIEIDINKLRPIIDEIHELSSDLHSLNTATNMTKEELSSGIINEKICLSRIKFFVDALERDLGINKKEQNSEE